MYEKHRFDDYLVWRDHFVEKRCVVGKKFESSKPTGLEIFCETLAPWDTVYFNITTYLNIISNHLHYSV